MSMHMDGLYRYPYLRNNIKNVNIFVNKRNLHNSCLLLVFAFLNSVAQPQVTKGGVIAPALAPADYYFSREFVGCGKGRYSEGVLE